MCIRDRFNDLRYWAYSNVSDARSSYDYDVWHSQVVARAIALNAFENPLALNEVLVVARSVAEFTYFRYKTQGAVITDAYRALQAKRGAIGGKKSKGGGRPPVIDSDKAREIDYMLLSKEYKQKEIAKKLNISLATLERYISKNKP